MSQLFRPIYSASFIVAPFFARSFEAGRKKNPLTACERVNFRMEANVGEWFLALLVTRMAHLLTILHLSSRLGQ